MKNNSIEIFKRIQKEFEDAKMQSNILKGEILSLSSQLKKLGFKNIKDAKNKTPKIERGLKKQKLKFSKMLSEFQNTYFRERK